MNADCIRFAWQGFGSKGATGVASEKLPKASPMAD